jgi:hypothetical protein
MYIVFNILLLANNSRLGDDIHFVVLPEKCDVNRSCTVILRRRKVTRCVHCRTVRIMN